MTYPLIVYIGGYGRAGSSMADLMLGSAPGVLGAGELFRLWHGKLEDQCLHGRRRPVEPFLEFWADVERRVGIPRAEAERIRLAVEPYPAWPTNQLYRDYEQLMRKLFAVLGDLGYTHVVDSSKNGRGARFRALHLLRCGLPVRFIHLRRDFIDTMRAVWRGTNEQILTDGTDRLRVVRAALGYHLAHRAADRCARWRDFSECRTLRFKDLMTRPENHIAAICEMVGIDRRPIVERLRAGEPFMVGHQIGGNRLYRAGQVKFRPPQPRDPWLKPLAGNIASIAVGAPILGLVFGGAGCAYLAHKAWTRNT